MGPMSAEAAFEDAWEANRLRQVDTLGDDEVRQLVRRLVSWCAVDDGRRQVLVDELRAVTP